jgi:hypothetical protein
LNWRICILAAVTAILPGQGKLAAERISVASPDGTIRLEVTAGGSGQLEWTATLNGRAVIEPSTLGIIVDGTDLSRGAEDRSVVSRLSALQGADRAGQAG